MNHQILYQWKAEIATRLGSLNSWQAENVALFSHGIIQAGSCQQEPIARQVACGERVGSAARRLRRYLDNEGFPLEGFFGEWTRWVLEALPGDRLYLLVDETKLADRIGVMMVGIAWEGRCIPLAWRSYRANSSTDYPAEGQVRLVVNLLQAVRGGIEEGREVIVLADRGLGRSAKLCQAVEALGWHYLFRVTSHTRIYTPHGDFTIARMVSPGQTWIMSGRLFKSREGLAAYACALWSQDYPEPWALITNHEHLAGAEYAHRNWQEQSFRDLKSGGWRWDTSHICHPDHMDRLLVLLALAYAWVLALGSHALTHRSVRPLQRHRDGQLRRHWSLFREGLLFFYEVVQRHSLFFQLAFVSDTRLT